MLPNNLESQEIDFNIKIEEIHQTRARPKGKPGSRNLPGSLAKLNSQIIKSLII